MEYLSQLLSRHRSRTAASLALATAAGQLADPPAPMPCHPLLGEIGYPIAAAGFAGSRFRDVDGNEYLDFSMAFGSALFGHNPDFVRTALIDQLERGFGVGPPSALAAELAASVAQMTGLQRVAFACSGTEAVMLALRLARTTTLRSRIALFTGSYHGQYDGTLAQADPAAPGHQGIPAAPGICRSSVADVLVLPFAGDDALQAVWQLRHGLAAVLIEPVQSWRPELQPVAFLRELRRITLDGGAALIFDEMVTGFRLAPGGAQERFGVRADMAVYGKVLSGGMPLAAVAGAARYLDAVDGGPWHGGASTRLRTFTASSFAKHPLSLAAARAVLGRLHEAGPALQQQLNDRTADLVSRLNDILQRQGAPLRYACCGSYFAPRRLTEEDGLSLQVLHCELVAAGVFLWGLAGFLSTAHEPGDLDRLCRAFDRAVRNCCAAGLVPGTPGDAIAERGGG